MHRLTATVCIALICWTAAAAELSTREKRMVDGVNATVRKAGMEFATGNYEAAGENIRKAMNQINIALKAGSGDLYDALGPAMSRITKAHALLELEGVSLPPFRRPKRPADQPAEPMQEDQPKPATPSDPSAISFTRQVAPILASRCGRCHIQGNRGNFTMNTFAALMKGPPEGVVIFAGDTVGSRLIETIETGDMPRGGGKVSPPELQTLKTWIMQGARFDGADPNAPLAGGPAPPPQNNNRPEVKMATGKETVSFAGDVAPLLVANCNGCHISAMQNRGGLRMDTFAQILRGGDSGEIIMPGRSADSLLIKKLKGEGIEGARMPAGGRPPLADQSIQLIAKWIDEGATLDGASATQPITVMSQLAWAANASAAEMTEKRAELADKNVKLASAGATVNSQATDHFRVVGTASQGTVELVAQQAEAHMKVVRGIVSGGDADEFYHGKAHGKATIFVFPRRYDYSEFAKMVESRSLPSGWTSHWKFDGIDGYLAVVATERDEEETISARLLSPLMSLAVATRGGDIPRWFAEGIGAAMAARKTGDRDRDAKLKREAETSEAIAAMTDAKSFLTGKLSPSQSDRIGAALAESMLDRGRRKSLDACLRLLAEGQGFDAAFSQAFRYPVATYIENWLKWARGG